MLRGLFVTGTDTGVGKTAVSAALLHRYHSQVPLRYWKPIQTGIEADNDTATVRQLTFGSTADALDEGVRLPRPVSPHLAAQLAGKPIDLGALTGLITSRPDAERWIVEGAGGVLVPINGSDLMVDLMRGLGLPVVVVARSSLGTINHTLLTLEGLRTRAIRVVGVVMVGNRDSHNRTAIEQYGQVEVVGEMPRFDSLTADMLTAWAGSEFDRDARLLEWLR